MHSLLLVCSDDYCTRSECNCRLGGGCSTDSTLCSLSVGAERLDSGMNNPSLYLTVCFWLFKSYDYSTVITAGIVVLPYFASVVKHRAFPTLLVNDLRFEDRAIAALRENYKFEYSQVADEGVNNDLLNKYTTNDAFETTVEQAYTNGEEIHLTVLLAEETEWIFSKPTAWTEKNEFVEFVNEFGITDVSDMEGQEVYIRFGEDGTDVSHDETGYVQLLHKWDELQENESSPMEENESMGIMQKIKSIIGF